MSTDFDTKQGGITPQQGNRDTSKLLVHDSDSGGEKTPYKGQGQEQLPSKAKVPTTATGEKL